MNRKMSAENNVIDLLAGVKAARAAGSGEGWQYLEVKQLAEILVRQREKLRRAIRDYRAHKRVWAAQTDAVEKLYLGYEGMFMRDHLRDAIRLYVFVNRDYHEAWRGYMAALEGPCEIKVRTIGADQESTVSYPFHRNAA